MLMKLIVLAFNINKIERHNKNCLIIHFLFLCFRKFYSVASMVTLHVVYDYHTSPSEIIQAERKNTNKYQTTPRGKQ